MSKFLELSVSLRDVLPRPLRRFRIRTTATFAELHEAIMGATGWSGSHLYAFIVERFGQPTPVAAPSPDGQPTDVDGFPTPDAARMRLQRQLGPEAASTWRYEYDFGDGWECDVLLHDVLDLSDRRKRIYVSGEFPWPPDDCGGPGGYAAIQDALRTGQDPQGLLAWAREVWEWSGRYNEEAVRREFDR
jgi:hypothetical protein